MQAMRSKAPSTERGPVKRRSSMGENRSGQPPRELTDIVRRLSDRDRELLFALIRRLANEQADARGR